MVQQLNQTDSLNKGARNISSLLYTYFSAFG